jgi:hypothetical protein
MIIAVDFDGTIVAHKFPDIGDEAPGATYWLKAWAAAGAKLILHTMRSDLHQPEAKSIEGHAADQPYLTQAVDWCAARGVRWWGVNENPEQKSWTLSPKPYAHIYVDDMAFGAPLREHPNATVRRPVLDWSIVGPAVLARLQEESRNKPAE